MTMTRQERLKRLARSLDRMAEADLKRVQEAERIAMLRNDIDDIRHFYANDLRFLRQF